MLAVPLAVLPWALPVIGFELSRKQGYALIIVSVLFIVAAVAVFFWPWVKGTWRWLRRDAELRKAQEKLREVEQARENMEEKLREARSSSTAHPRYDKVIEEQERLRAENADLKQQQQHNVVNTQIRVKAALAEQGIQELKRRCREWGNILSWFLEDHAPQDSDNALDPQVEQRDLDAMAYYNKRYRLSVATLLEQLEQRGLWNPSALDEGERKRLKKPSTTYAVQRVADLLQRIGNE